MKIKWVFFPTCFGSWVWMGNWWAAKSKGETCGVMSGNFWEQDQGNPGTGAFSHSSVPRGHTSIQTSMAIPLTHASLRWLYMENTGLPTFPKPTECPRDARHCSRPSNHGTEDPRLLICEEYCQRLYVNITATIAY